MNYLQDERISAHFKLSEFIIDNQEPSDEVLSKIIRYHAVPLEEVRAITQSPIFISKKSCYRSPEYEKKQGRKYISEHQFKGKGACDVVYTDEILQLLITMTKYTKLIVYVDRKFIHCDYTGKSQTKCEIIYKWTKSQIGSFTHIYDRNIRYKRYE